MAEPWRYPFNPGLNQSAQLPTSFGPPNMSQQIQGALGGLLDPFLAKLEEQRKLKAGEGIYGTALSALGDSYKPAVTPTSVTPPAQTNTARSTPEDLHAPLAATTAVSDPVAPGLKPHEQALLNGIAKPESGGRYDIRYSPGGGTTFAETGEHPGLYEPGPAGPSSAAGRYQFVKSTWDRVAGDAPFTRENQDLMALKLAREDYNARTKRDLDVDLLSEGFSPRIQRALQPTWAGLGKGLAENAAVYNATLARAAEGGAAPTVAQAPAPAAVQQASLAEPPPAFRRQAAPAPAPQASFAPQVAPAPNPAAAAAVTAPPGQPTMAQPTMPLPRRGPQAQGGAPIPQAPQMEEQAQNKQEQQQQEILANVGRGNQEVTQRLNGVRAAGQESRTQIASLDPNAGISPRLPDIGLGGVMPGAPQQPPPQPNAAYDPALTAPRPVRTTPEQAIEPPPDVPLPPPRPPAPAGPSPAAPAAAAGAPVVPPPVVPAANPIRVAQNLPPVVSDQQGVVRPISDADARRMLASAVTPEQQAAVFEIVRQSRQPPKQSADRFQLIHDKDGNWVQLDRLTGATRAQPISGAPGSTVSKEVREAERALFNDFESTESVKKYRELEQGVQGLKSAFQGGSANADLVAVIQMFKAIDPGSTVTGGENATFRNAAGVPETLRALFNRGVGQGGQFSPELRAEIFNTAQRLQQGRVKQIEQHAQAYRNRAKAYGLDPDRTIAFQPFQFEKAKAADFPDIDRRREGEDAAAAPRAPLTAGSSRENPMDVPSMAAAEELAARMPAGSKTFLRLPGGKIWVAE